MPWAEPQVEMMPLMAAKFFRNHNPIHVEEVGVTSLEPKKIWAVIVRLRAEDEQKSGDQILRGGKLENCGFSTKAR